MRRLVRIVLIVFSMFAAAPAAHAQKRVALVIGNSAYQHTPKLANPKNDATDMAATLKKLGLEVIEGFDLDKAAFDRKVHEFATALRGGEAGVFYYAGHGMQVSGRNYLVPVSAKAEAEELLDLEMVRVDVVQRVMEVTSKTNVLFLDACRDNPLARNLARSMGTRSVAVGWGLATIESGVGTLISFSTHPGAVASDGSGRNSPYTAALVKHIASAGDDLNTILINVRRDVRRETQGKQVPWEHSSLEGRFYFNTPAAPKQAPALATELQPYQSAFIGRLRDLSTNHKDVHVVGDRVVVQSDGLFPPNKASLTGRGLAAIDLVATVVIELERTIPREIDWVLQVDGHTDVRPIKSVQYPSNWELSTARATSILKYIISRGVSPNRLLAAGYGEFQPLIEGPNEDALRRNRRIEFKLRKQ